MAVDLNIQQSLLVLYAYFFETKYEHSILYSQLLT
jgi:hypothetical protein